MTLAPARPLAYILQILLLATAYFITGKLGTYLAIPPGYATAIWPPSGIALAGILLCGYRAWPGILLGSILVNFSTSFAGGTPSEAFFSFVITLAISSGAALQAIFGAYLLRRFGGFPNPLSNEKEIFSFMLLAGLLSPLINASIGVTALVIADRVALSNALANWGTWWVGDAVGILIFTPLVLAWLLRPAESWHDRRLAITFSILIAFLLTTALASYSSQKEVKHLKLEFAKDAAEFGTALKQNILLHLNVLRSIESFYSASNNKVDRQAFKVFTEDALNNLHGIQALSWNPIVLHSERAAFERTMRHQAVDGFKITELNNRKQLVRAANRPEYVPVGFIESIKENKSALGYDVYSDAIRREAINRARDTGKIAATARITLVQEQNNQFGVLAFMPIYKKGISTKTTAERRSAIKGYVVAVFRGGDIVAAALNNTINHNHLAYQLIDTSAVTGEQLLFVSNNKEQQVKALTQKGLFTKNLTLNSQININVGGRLWQAKVIPTQDYIAAHRTDTTWYILLVGLLLTSLVSIIVLITSGRRDLLKKLVDEKTLELQASYEHLHKLSQQVPGVIYQFKLATDGHYSFPYASEGICDIYGVTPEQVREDANVVFNIAHPDDYDAIIASIQESARSLKPWNLEYRVKLPKQGIQWLHGQALPEKLEDGSILWHGFISNITERKNADAIFHGIFEQSSFLAGILDQNGNLVNVNETAMDFTSASREEVIGQYFPDTPWWNHTEERMQLIEVLDCAYAGKYASFEATHPTPEGGYINVLFSATPIVLGSGVYVSVTGINITQRKLMEVKLRMLSTAIEQSPASVAIANLDAKLEYVNPRFEQVTGYSSAEILGQNPRILQSGLTDKSVHTDMWEKLSNGQRWVGELINKRKNGDIYYEEAYISPVKNDDNKISHYVAVKLDITERKEMEKQVNQLAFYDALTKLPNRRLLDDRLNQAISSSKRSHYYGALMFLDLDNFKPLNDLHGHVVGDLLLIDVARRLERCMRKMDTVARFGGDEFVLMLPKLNKDKATSLAQAKMIAEKIRAILSKPYLLQIANAGKPENSVEHHCTASIGVALFTGHESSPDDIMKWADAAMYAAKDAGRNQIRFYNEKS